MQACLASVPSGYEASGVARAAGVRVLVQRAGARGREGGQARAPAAPRAAPRPCPSLSLPYYFPYAERYGTARPGGAGGAAAPRRSEHPLPYRCLYAEAYGIVARPAAPPPLSTVPPMLISTVPAGDVLRPRRLAPRLPGIGAIGTPPSPPPPCRRGKDTFIIHLFTTSCPSPLLPTQRLKFPPLFPPAEPPPIPTDHPMLTPTIPQVERIKVMRQAAGQARPRTVGRSLGHTVERGRGGTHCGPASAPDRPC